jgi:hypothetical protein
MIDLRVNRSAWSRYRYFLRTYLTPIAAILLLALALATQALILYTSYQNERVFLLREVVAAIIIGMCFNGCFTYLSIIMEYKLFRRGVYRWLERHWDTGHLLLGCKIAKSIREQGLRYKYKYLLMLMGLILSIALSVISSTSTTTLMDLDLK